MHVETFSLDHFSEVRSKIEAAIGTRNSIFVEVPGDELPRILEAIELDRNMPRSIVGRLKVLFRIPHLSRGLAADFLQIYLLAKQHRMSARAESLHEKRGILFTPR